MSLTRAGWVGALLVGAGTAVLIFLLLTVGLHLWRDHQALHLYDQILGYNLKAGRLILPQQVPPTATPPPAQP